MESVLHPKGCSVAVDDTNLPYYEVGRYAFDSAEENVKKCTAYTKGELRLLGGR